MVSLERIAEENVKFEIRKKEKQDVQVQIRQMREQLTIKKQKLIDELKEMRKEFHLNNENEDELDTTEFLKTYSSDDGKLNYIKYILKLQKKKQCSMAGSNRRPSRYKHAALPTELMELN